MFPNRVPMERDAPSPEPMVYSFIYIRQDSPVKGPSTENGENIRSPFTEPHVYRRPTYNAVRPGSPRGSFTTLLSLPQCHAAFSTITSTLVLVDHTPLAGMCRSNPHQGSPSTPVTASHVTQGTVRIHITLRYG